MNVIKGNTLILLLTVLAFSTLALVGCNQDNRSNMIGPAGDAGASFSSTQAKKGNGKGGGNTNTDNGNSGQVQFPISISRTYEFLADSNYYDGGNLHFGHVSNQSYFVLDDNALTPPKPNKNWGKDIEITMDIDYDSTANELQFTFGPHGCQFSPRAKIRLDYKRLGIDLANLYYIDENGSYIPQSPDHVNTQGKWVMISVDHFSRYALAAD